MAPAAAETASNWLSFSLSPVEMLASSHHHHQTTPQILPTAVPSSHHYATTSFFDTYYSNDWTNPKSQGMYADYTVDQQNPVTVPKLEDFLGGDNTASYNSQTETTTQDESSQLTHLYDPHPAATNYFHQDLKSVGFGQPVAANSGSEVDDSAEVGRPSQASEFMGQSIDTASYTAAAQCGSGGGSLSLAVVGQSSEKALVVVATPTATATVADSDSAKKITDTFGQRTSIYRGVTRHRWTGRYEAHLWDNSCRREGQARKGRQVYLGGYDKEEKAARAYDLAALKYWGPTATTNFPISNYTKELEEMKNVTKQEFIASLRRKSSGFSRGASIYRGVTRHHQQGRWQARIGRVAGNKDLYLGTFATEEEAAEAYDIAAIKFRGVNAVTNFEMSRYNVEAILNSNLPVGGAAKRLKLATESSDHQRPGLSLDQHSQSSNGGSSGTSSTINFAGVQAAPHPQISYNNMAYDTAAAIYNQNLLHHLSSGGTQSATPETFSMALMTPPSQTSSEFYLWPHQSY